ncbi:MAG TPA: hypothetical protein VM165_18640 [Planctomycetaceae bacterium]|nr:hypothetical protein [Planctomycetaceae bacterium]
MGRYRAFPVRRCPKFRIAEGFVHETGTMFMSKVLIRPFLRIGTRLNDIDRRVIQAQVCIQNRHPNGLDSRQPGNRLPKWLPAELLL